MANTVYIIKEGKQNMKKAYVVGIAGGSASGKSTIAKKLEGMLEGLNVLVIPMDTYFKPAEERAMVNAPITGKIYRDDNHPTSFRLPELKQDLSEAIDGGEVQVIILEGLLTLWDNEIYDKLDLRLFLECRPDERIVRRLRRNMARGLTFDEIADVYLDMVRYRHDEFVEPSKWRADFILNGSNPSEVAFKILVDHIKASI